jgi:hypothetical protein
VPTSLSEVPSADASHAASSIADQSGSAFRLDSPDPGCDF